MVAFAAGAFVGSVIYLATAARRFDPPIAARAPDPWSPARLRAMPALIDPEEIIAGGPPKDGIPALTDPQVIAAAQADYLATADRVIGVEINGEARAYPLAVLLWHEIINERVGGRPIVVTYCPLCDSALVFDRRVGGQVREFGVSGKLWRSNVLMYDRQADPGRESLWSQIRMEAVVGPAAADGLKLRLLASTLTTWGEWRRRYPATQVLSSQTGHARDYRRSPYASYFAHDGVGFGVAGKPARRPDLRNKDRVVAVEVGGSRRIYPVRDVAAAAADLGWVEDTLGGVRLRLEPLPEAESLKVEAADPSTTVTIRLAYAFWFAWENIQPGDDLWSPIDSEARRLP